MDVQSIVFSGLQDILTILIGALVAYGVAFVKQHFSARQIATATWIAGDAVNFAAQEAKKLGMTENSTKYLTALTKAKELAAKAGLKFTDSQWETLIESAYKKAKDEAKPLQDVVSSTPAMTKDEIITTIQAEAEKIAQKVAPGVPVDQIESVVTPLIQKALGNLSLSVNVAPTVQAAPVSDQVQPVADTSADAQIVQANADTQTAQPDQQPQTQQPA